MSVVVYTAFNRPSPVPSSSGCEDFIEWKEVLDDQGHTVLAEVGRTNIHDYIQAGYEGGVYEMLDRCTLTGDDSILHKVVGTYADITNMPKTLAESLEMAHGARDLFESLPLTFRQQFGNDYGVFLTKLNSGEASVMAKNFMDSTLRVEQALTPEVPGGEKNE